MKKGYSLIDILIIISFFALGFVVFKDYLPKKPIQPANINLLFTPNFNSTTTTAKASSSLKSKSTSTAKNNIQNVIPNISIENKVNNSQGEPLNSQTSLDNQNQIAGYYYNPKYRYEIFYPSNWPRKVRDEENVSLGITPPKNGQGVITIKVGGDDVYQEIEEAKKQAAKYPGIVEFRESETVLGGIKGTKLEMINNLNQDHNFYIIIKKDNYYYLVEYSYQSESFIKQVEKALKTFKFK